MLTLALLLTLAIGLSQAQGPGPDSAAESQESLGPAAAMSDGIPIQGRLTNASGAPLTGDHSVTFSLYDDPAAGNLLCSTNYNPLPMTNGLFNVTVTGCTDSDIDGDQLYLGVQVDADAAMTPRQPIYAVPYARSLRPGADIRGDVSNASILALYNANTADNSKGLYASATTKFIYTWTKMRMKMVASRFATARTNRSSALTKAASCAWASTPVAR